MDRGVLAGFPVVDISVDLYDGSAHDVDSSEIAFKLAAINAFQEGMRKAKPVILEPVMKLEVVVPEKFMGDVTGMINSKRGTIEGFGELCLLPLGYRSSMLEPGWRSAPMFCRILRRQDMG